MKAWKRVVHIESRTGPHGGRHWILTLECGHHAVHKQPRLSPVQAAGLRRVRSTFAPKKKLCWVCSKKAPRLWERV